MRVAANEADMGIIIDSCGTAAYHVGNPPDPRSIDTAFRNGTDISDLRARQLCAEDFARFTHIFAMDHENLRNIQAARPDGATAQISLLMDAVKGREGAAIADPYYDGEEHFQFTWDDVSAAAQALIQKLK